MRMQALAIAMVIVGGVSIFIMSLSTLDSLYETRESYYRDHHFAQVFASLKRAPLALIKRIREIPGVDKVETRVVAYVNLDVAGFDDPVSSHLLSLPDNSPGTRKAVGLPRVFAQKYHDLGVFEISVVVATQHALRHPELTSLLLRKGVGSILHTQC